MTNSADSILERFSLAGKVALITGGSKGIGKGIAQAFSEAGASVVCSARTAADTISSAAEISAATGNQALGLACDVCDPQQRQQLIEKTIAEFGQLDILVNNAGGAGPNKPEETSCEDFAHILDWNVTPAFDLIRIAVPHLRKSSNGNVINISSGAAHIRQQGFSAYGSAKAALSHMTRLLAQDFAPHVRVNAIEPGAILTDALERFLTGDMKATMEKNTPMRRLGSTQDVGAAALFLASPAAAWITGKIIELDGGVEAPVW